MSDKIIPIYTAKEIGEKYEKHQVIIVAWCRETGTTTVTTWGDSIQDCDQAAQGGDFIKKALGWPDSLKQLPNRVQQLVDENEELKKKLAQYEADSSSK